MKVCSEWHSSNSSHTGLPQNTAGGVQAPGHSGSFTLQLSSLDHERYTAVVSPHHYDELQLQSPYHLQRKPNLAAFRTNSLLQKRCFRQCASGFMQHAP